MHTTNDIKTHWSLSYLSVSVSRITAKVDRPISLKLGVIIGHTIRRFNQQYWGNSITYLVTCGGDLVPDMDPGFLLHFPHHNQIEHLRRFISISRVQSPTTFHTNRQNICSDKRMHPYFGRNQTKCCFWAFHSTISFSVTIYHLHKYLKNLNN